MDKHLPGAFSADPRLYACPSWYGEVGQFLTTKFFGMKINKYMHDHGISHETLAKVAAKNYRNGALNPNAFRRKPLSEEEILASPMLNYPLTQYMFCSPDEGAAAVVLCQAEHAHRYTDTPIYLRATTVRTRRLGAFEVHSPWLPIEETVGPDRRRVARRVRDGGHRPRGRRRDPAAGHRRRRRGDPPRRERLLRRRRAGGAGRRRRARDRRPAAGEHRRRADRERRADRRVRPAAGARGRAAAARPGRRPPGARATRRSATRSSTARPAPPASPSSPPDPPFGVARACHDAPATPKGVVRGRGRAGACGWRCRARSCGRRRRRARRTSRRRPAWCRATSSRCAGSRSRR